MSISKLSSKHPIAILLSHHIRNFEEKYDVPFYKSYFIKLSFNKLMYYYGMKKAMRKVDQLKFMKKLGLDEGTNLTTRIELWKDKNRYNTDSDNNNEMKDDLIYLGNKGFNECFTRI